jgi:hypothetical protein
MEFENLTSRVQRRSFIFQSDHDARSLAQVVDIVRGAPLQAAASANASAAGTSSASSSGASSSSDDKSSSAAVEIAPSMLEPTTAELVKTLFDTDMFKTAMVEIKGAV